MYLYSGTSGSDAWRNQGCDPGRAPPRARPARAPTSLDAMARLAGPLLLVTATYPTHSGSAPIPKRLRWFGGQASAMEKLLLEQHPTACTGIIPCCNIAAIYPNGTFRSPRGNASSYQHWISAGRTVHISINAHAASIDVAVARKEAFAEEVAAAGRRLNVSGFTLDFEDGNGDHIDEWVSLWSTVRDALHPHGMTLGNCVCEDVWLKPNATGSQNYGGANQTAWAFLWDIKPQVPVFDFLTDMSTYVSHATAIPPPPPPPPHRPPAVLG
eukprot:SAG22_NODE_16_length_32723_cov_26.404825_22_plen_270_part_00